MKQQTCENLSSIGHRSCEMIMKEITPLSHEVCGANTLGVALLVRKLLLIMFYYYQPLPIITHFQVRFYANNHFE